MSDKGNKRHFQQNFQNNNLNDKFHRYILEDLKHISSTKCILSSEVFLKKLKLYLGLFQIHQQTSTSHHDQTPTRLSRSKIFHLQVLNRGLELQNKDHP